MPVVIPDEVELGRDQGSLRALAGPCARRNDVHSRSSCEGLVSELIKLWGQDFHLLGPAQSLSS